MSWWPRRTVSSDCTDPWTARTPTCGAFCVANASRPPSCWPRRAIAGAQRWLDRIRHRKLSISGDDLVAAGLTGAQVGEGLSRAMVALLDGRAPGREDQLRAALVSCAVNFRWENEQLVGELPHARVVFSSARGGVSAGPYASLNLGLLTDDTPENVAENRRRLGETVGHPWPRFCYGRQVHGATVRRATEPPSAARPYTHEDGQATALTDAAAIVFVADCLPVMLAAEGAVAALHCGWKPLAAGIVAEGVAALREVGGTGRDRRRARPERPRLLLRGRRGGPRALRGLRRPPRRAQPRSRGRRQGAARCRRDRHRRRRRAVHDVRRPLLLPSPRQGHHRPPGGGHMPRLITGLVGRADRRATSSGCARRSPTPGAIPPTVEILAAVKYVPIDELGTLHEAGLTLLGENRAQDLEDKADAAPGLPLALHRPAAVAQGPAPAAVRRADPLGGVGVGAQAARDPRDARHRDPARGQCRGRGRQGRDRSERASRGTSSSPPPRSWA